MLILFYFCIFWDLIWTKQEIVTIMKVYVYIQDIVYYNEVYTKYGGNWNEGTKERRPGRSL